MWGAILGLGALVVSFPVRSTGSASSAIVKLYNEGANAFSHGQYAAAIAYEDQALALDPAYYPAYNVKGIALCYATDHGYQAAMQNIEKALTLNPNYGYARFNKALCEERYGYYKQAIATYTWAIDLHVKEWWVPWAYYGIASIYGRWGDAADAVAYLKKAMALNRSSIQAAARTEPDFAPIRDNPQFRQLVGE